VLVGWHGRGQTTPGIRNKHPGHHGLLSYRKSLFNNSPAGAALTRLWFNPAVRKSLSTFVPGRYAVVLWIFSLSAGRYRHV